MNCPRCNSQIQAGNSFCSSCGFNLNEQNNVNNNNFSNQNNINNNQQMMYPNQMQQGNYNQFQQGTVQNGKLGKLAIFMIVLFDTVSFLVFCNLVVFLGDAKKRKNNINK